MSTHSIDMADIHDGDNVKQPLKGSLYDTSSSMDHSAMSRTKLESVPSESISIQSRIAANNIQRNQCCIVL